MDWLEQQDLHYLDWLPEKAQAVVLLLPMVHGVEMIREGYFGNVIRTHFDWAYMFQANLVLTLVGLLVTRDAARRVEAR